MSKKESIKVILSIVLLLAYAIPLVFNSSTNNANEFIFVDFIYAVGSSIGIGCYLIADSYKLQRPYEYFLVSAGAFFIGLAIIFIIDTVSDRTFRTYWYVVFNLITTLLCFISLRFKSQYTR